MTINLKALSLGVGEVVLILQKMRVEEEINAQDFHEKITVPLKMLGYLADDFESDLVKNKIKVGLESK